MEEKLVRWPNEDIKEEHGQAENITRALLDSNLKVLEKYFHPFAVHQHYCHIILPKYYKGERLVHEVYLYLSRFFQYEELINQNLCFILSQLLSKGMEQPVSKVLNNYEQTVQQFYAASNGNNSFLKTYLYDCALAALNQYAPLLQLKDIRVEVDETDRANGIINFTITYVFLPTNTRHNYVFPFYL